MKRLLTILMLAGLLAGCKSEAPRSTVDFPMMPFRFVGSLHSVSTNSYLNVHGEEWGMGITIERMLEGSYDDTNILWIGISDPTEPLLQPNRKYDIRAAWGRHGMMLLDFKEVE